MATLASDTLRESEVLVEVGKTAIQAEKDQEMDDDSAEEDDRLFDFQEGPSHAEARVETSNDTSGGGDDRSNGEPETPSKAETNKKVDFVLVYETWEENEAEDVEAQPKPNAMLRKRFEHNLQVAGLDIIDHIKDVEPSPVSSLTLLFLWNEDKIS